MIEISGSGLGRARNDIRSRKKKGASASDKMSFASELSDVVDSEYVSSVDGMLTELESQEKRFIDLQSRIELEKYKSMVKNILKFIMEEGFENKALSLSFRERRLGRAEKTVIETIDKNLVELSQMITKSNEAFSLLKKIEEIRGLICDLVY